MKKRFAPLAALLSLLFLTSCMAKDAGTLYVEAFQKTNALEYVHSVMEMNYTVEMAGISTEMPTTIESRIHNNGEQSVLDMDITVSMLGVDFTSSVYYADNVAYTEAVGVKTKITMDPEEFQKLFETNGEIAFERDDFAEVEVLEQDGKYSFSVTLDGEAYTELIMENVMGSLLENLGLDEVSPDALTVTISDIDLAVVIDDNGYFEQYDMLFNVEIGASGDLTSLLGGTNMKIDCDMKITYLDIGKELVIEAPADLDSYVEANA